MNDLAIENQQLLNQKVEADRLRQLVGEREDTIN